MLLGKTIVITGISSGIGARIGELALALGADIIGVDVNPPARPLDAFIKADIGSAQGVAEIVETLPRRFDALCNVAGVSGMIGAAKTLAIPDTPARRTALDYPFAGARILSALLRRQGVLVGRLYVATLMKRMNEAIYRRPISSKPAQAH